MSDFKGIMKEGSIDDRGSRYLCATVLLAFILSAGFFLSACGGGGSTGDPTPDPGNGNGGEGPAVTVSFGEVSYSVTEGESVTLAVTLSADPERTVAIPVMVDDMSTAADGDYSPLPESVTFASGETSKDITVAALEDSTDDDGETVILNFGTLPERVSAGTTSSTTVTITDPCEGAVSVTGTEVYDVKTADNGEDSDPDGEGVFICGDEMANVIKGGSGDDTIRGRGGDDTLQGREGNDTLIGGAGEDTVIYRIANEAETTLLEPLDVSLETGTATNDGYGGTDTLAGIENVGCEGYRPIGQGGIFSRIEGDAQDNRIEGCDIDDLLVGLGGNDTFVVSDGTNYYDGGSGTDTLETEGIILMIDLSIVNDTDVSAPGDTSGGGGYRSIGSGEFAKLETTDVTTVGGGNSTIENIIGGPAGDTFTGDWMTTCLMAVEEPTCL